MDMVPKFLQGVFPFKGAGFEKPALLHPSLAVAISGAKRGQLVYFRAGNSSSELVCFELRRNGEVMRLFPVGAKADTHVPLAVVEDLDPDTRLEVFFAAPAGAEGIAVIDIGLVEI
jgi:assimilatory nitrate reductase catalytic subunit